LDVLLQQWIVVLEEELQEFLLASPLHLVVILQRVWLVGAALGRSALREQRLRGSGKQDGQQQLLHDHRNEPSKRASIHYTRAPLPGPAGNRRARDRLK